MNMTAFSAQTNTRSVNNFELGIEGFCYADLFDAVKLKQLGDAFYAEVGTREPVLHAALVKYIDARGHGYERKVESKILTDAAPFLSDFIGRLFNISRERGDLERDILTQNPVWKYKFFVQRRAIKKYKADSVADLNEAQLWQALMELRNNSFDETLVRDEELSIAEMTCRLLDAEEELARKGSDSEPAPLPSAFANDTVKRINAAYDQLKDSEFGKFFSQYVIDIDATGDLLTIKAALQLIEAWSATAFHNKSRNWYSFKVPHSLNYQNLVHLIHPEPHLHNIMRGAEDVLRKRDGFKLTDDRGTQREVLSEIDYCLICH